MAGTQSMATALKLVKAGSEATDTTLAHVTSIGEQTSEAEEIDVTTLDSPNRSKEFMPGAKDHGSIEVAFNNCFDGEVEKIRALFASGEIRTWEELYPDDAGKTTYTGYVAAVSKGEVAPDGLLTYTFTIRLTAEPVYTES